MPAKLVIPGSYEEFAEGIVSGEISVGFSTAVLYVMTKDKHPEDIHYLATCKQTKGGKSRAHYYGYFLVSKNSPYKSLNELKGKKWGFTKKTSSSGYQYPMAFFARKNIDPDSHFSEVMFLKKHPKITDALATWTDSGSNIIDGGATWDVNIWEAEKSHGQVYRKIARVGPIPMQPVVVSKKIAGNKILVQKIKDALIGPVPPEVIQSEGFPYSGWKIGKDEDYDIVRSVVEQNKKKG